MADEDETTAEESAAPEVEAEPEAAEADAAEADGAEGDSLEDEDLSAWGVSEEDIAEDDGPGAPEPAQVSAPAIHGVSLEASAILGTTLMPVSQLLKMGRGAVVELDKSIGDTIDVSVNDQLVARGEVMIKDDRLCVEITEMVKRISS